MATFITTAVAGGDGNVYIDAGGTWANVKAQVTGTADASVDPVNVYTGNLGGGTNRSIGRMFIPFDTALLPVGAIISALTITVTCTAVLGASTFDIVESTQADPTSLVGGDFDAIPGATGTMTSFSSLAISTTGAKVFTLDANGIANINPGGYSLFALVENHDVTNTDPGLASDYRISVNTSNNGTAGNRPTLEVTYILSGGFFNLI